MEYEEDQDSLFGSPPPSPRIPTTTLSLPFASIYDNDRRLSTSTDTQNVGTIALPGSHLYSELPLNPLALSLNCPTVHRPPAQPQDQPTTAKQTSQPWQPLFAQSDGSEKRRSSKSPFSNVPSRDPEFSFPDPSAPPPAHFLRNQQNLLGKAGLVAGVKPSTIAHIRGTSFNPIVIEDEDTPILGRRSRDSPNRYADPSLLAAPSNEDIVSVLTGQKDIFLVIAGILDIIERRATQPTPPTTSIFSRNDPSKQRPIKRRRLIHVPAGANDWDVPYPFQEGEGPDEYHKTWERKRAKDLVAQLVKLVKSAARKAAVKNHLRKEEARQAIWEKLMEPELQNQPPLPSQVSLDSIVSSLVAAQSSHTSSPEGDGWDEIGRTAFSDFLSEMAEEGNITPMVGEEGKGKEVLRTDPLEFSSADATIPTQDQESPPHNTLVGTQSTDVVLPPSYEFPEQHLTPVSAPQAPCPKPKSTIPQSRKEDILKRAREKRRQIQEELDSVKTQLWETTIEQAALIHLMKRYEND